MYTKKEGFAKADFDPKTILTIPNIVTAIRLVILPFVATFRLIKVRTYKHLS